MLLPPMRRFQFLKRPWRRALKTLYTEEQQADALGIAPKTLANQRSAGNGPPFIKVGRLVRYDPEVTAKWLAERTFTSTSEAEAA